MRLGIILPITAAIQVVATGAEQRVPQAEERLVVSGQGFFPVAQLLQDGRIAVVLRGGAAHVGIKGRLDMVVSEDHGKTWSNPAVVVDSPLDDRNPAFGQARNGTLVVAFWRAAKDSYRDYEMDDPRQPVSTWVTRSDDRGKAWSEPTEIDVRDIGYGSPYGKIVTLPDGTMLMNVYGFGVRPPGEALPAKEDHSYLYRSTDHGKSWKRHATIAAKFNETGLLRLPSGSLLAALRSAGDKSSVSITRSDDDGQTWSAPKRVTEPSAHPADLTLLRDGRVLMVVGARSAPFGVCALIGNAENEFDWPARTILAADSTNADTGYPSSIIMGERRVLTFYYATGSRTHSEWGVHCAVVDWQPPALP